MSPDTQRTLVLLMEALASTEGPQERLRLVLREMIDVTGASGGLVSNCTSEPGQLRLGHEELPLDAADAQSFHKKRLHFFPCLLTSDLGVKLLSGVASVGSPEELVGAEAWHACEYFRECIAPFRLSNAVVSSVQAPGSRWIMTLIFPHDRRPPRNCLELLRALDPYLGRALSRLVFPPDARIEGGAIDALVACNREPIVAVRLGDKSKPAQLLGATGGAAEIIRLRRVTASHNLDLAELLRLCPTALRLDTGSVVWTAHDGRMYALKAARVSADPSSLVVRLKPLSAPDTEGSADVAAARACGLSVRRAEVFALVAQGLSNRQIGLALKISPNTARTHVSKLIKTLGVSGRVEAINKVRSEVRARLDGSAVPACRGVASRYDSMHPLAANGGGDAHGQSGSR
ncbi:MAG: LuxR C-terminal-related transcriptional regulator [Planctomycetota bacterium]|nr:LuxR C-terminal-related transcriptional regulator [Planctomycetota bacterium]